MNRTLQRMLGLVGIAGLVAAASGCAHHHAHGHAHRAGREGGGLSVIGTGEAKAAPDIARSSMGIEVHGATAEAATADANARMAAVLAALRGAGIADADLRTNDFSVSFERDNQPAPVEPPAPPVKGSRAASATAAAPAQPATPRGSYRVSNTVEVVIRDIAKVGEVLTAAAAAGANNVWGISFELADREPLYQQARAHAIEAGKRTATQLAQLTGVKLGRLVAVEDQPEQGGPRMMGYAARMSDGAGGGSAVPVQGGQLTVSHQVRLVYALDQP